MYQQSAAAPGLFGAGAVRGDAAAGAPAKPDKLFEDDDEDDPLASGGAPPAGPPPGLFGGGPPPGVAMAKGGDLFGDLDESKDFRGGNEPPRATGGFSNNMFGDEEKPTAKKTLPGFLDDDEDDDLFKPA